MKRINVNATDIDQVIIIETEKAVVNYAKPTERIVDVKAERASDASGNMRGQLTELRQILSTRFDDGDLRTLCFDLAVNYDALPGEGTANKARELIKYLAHHDRISELVEIGNRSRPDISWPDLSSK